MRTWNHSIPAFFVLTVAAVAPAAAGAPSAMFWALGDLPGGDVYSETSAVSADGSTVVGWSRIEDTGVPGFLTGRAFRWTVADGMVELADPSHTRVFTFPHDVSGDGSMIVGECRNPTNSSDSGPCYWTPTGGLTDIVDTDGIIVGYSAFGVSNDGTIIAGTGRSPSGGIGWRWTEAAGMESLVPEPSPYLDSGAFALSDNGVAATGHVMVNLPDVGPFHWTEATGLVPLGDVPGGVFYALGYGISPDGSTVVGQARACDGTCEEAFLWSSATGFILLDPSHGADGSSGAVAATTDGSTVFGGKVGMGATVWDATHGLRSLQDILTNDYGLDLTGWTLLGVTGCTPDGLTLVGNGTNPSGNREGWMVRLQPSGAVPATSDWGLVALAITTIIAGTLIQRRAARA